MKLRYIVGQLLLLYASGIVLGQRVQKLYQVMVEDQFGNFSQKYVQDPINNLVDPAINILGGLYEVFINDETGKRIVLGSFREPDFYFMIDKTLVIVTDDPNVILHCTFLNQSQAQAFYCNYYEEVPRSVSKFMPVPSKKEFVDPQYKLLSVQIHRGGPNLSSYVGTPAAIFIENLPPIDNKNRRRFTVATHDDYFTPYLIFSSFSFDVHNRRRPILGYKKGQGEIHEVDEKNRSKFEIIKNEVILIVKQKPNTLHYFNLKFENENDGVKFIEDVAIIHNDVEPKLVFDMPHIIERLIGSSVDYNK